MYIFDIRGIEGLPEIRIKREHHYLPKVSIDDRQTDKFIIVTMKLYSARH